MLNGWRQRRNDRLLREQQDHVTCATFYAWVRRAVAGYVVLTLGFLGNTYVDRKRAESAREALAQSGNVVSIVGCNRDFKLYVSIRAVFKRSEASARQQHKQGLLTDEQFARMVAANRALIREFPLPDCREVANVLTTAPDKAEDRQPPPSPLYPGSPEAREMVRKAGG